MNNETNEILLDLLDVTVELDKLKDNLIVIGCAIPEERHTPQMLSNAVLNSATCIERIIGNIDAIQERNADIENEESRTGGSER